MNKVLVVTFIAMAVLICTEGSLRSISPLGNSLTIDLKRKSVSPRNHQLNAIRTKRQIKKSVLDLQANINKAKETCGLRLGFTPAQLQKSLLYEENPTAKERCLIECILKKTKIMGPDNKLSLEGVGRIAQMVSENNPLVVNIALATATNCNNRLMNTQSPCVAAGQINKCVAKEIKAHKIKIAY